jgi:flagellar biosynthesis protein FlhF
MTVRRITAPTAREALRRVKDELGPDAIVVANKPVPGGIEITAMSADSLDALSGSTPSRRPVQTASVQPVPPPKSLLDEFEDDYTVSLSAKAHSQVPFRAWQPVAAVPELSDETVRPRLRPLPTRPELDSPSLRNEPVGPNSSATTSAGSGIASAMSSQPQVAQLMAEMQSIKSLLERQLAGFAWGEMSRQNPAQATLLAEMLDSGFSSALARRLVEEMPRDMTSADGRKWLANAINRRLRTLTGDTDLIDQGGVFALVGPTGVGKTTTTAKLAARCVVRYGAERMALLTTDGYRIGAHEQLRIYGRILGVPVHVVRDSDDLRRTLVDLRDKHMILIDTVGMSQRDRMVAEQAAMLTRAGEVKRLLLLNAGSRGDTLDDVVRAYSGEDLAGCVLTKVDEAASLGPAIDAVIRHGLLLAYVANGQRVPEDMHLPNRNYLLHRAFKLPVTTSPHRLQGSDVGMIAGLRSAPNATQEVSLD